MTKDKNPPKWHEVHRGNDDKCVFVGKDGASGLIRGRDKDGKKFDWRTTDKIAEEAGLSKKKVEEILEYYCNRGIIRQHPKDPEKWGYWQNVGAEKGDPDVVSKDHESRIDKVLGKIKPVTTPSKAIQQPTHTAGHGMGTTKPKLTSAPPGLKPKTVPTKPATKAPAAPAPAPVVATP